MEFKDFSKEARIKEEFRIKELENNVISKASKMALDKFSKVYGITTKVAVENTNLKEFKRNYLSGKIASILSIDTKDGVKNVPFTIVVKASEPSILESDAIMKDKIANTEGSLEKEINEILNKQNNKLANLKIEEENNKNIIKDLSKGVSLEASRRVHILKEAAKKKEVGHNSLSTVTTPTNILNELVEFFTYPKTFFPAMKVGATVDIGGVKYKYIGDEATMTEPAGNTNGTIARFELANKKKASLDKKASLTEEDIEKIIGMAGYIADQDEEQQKRSLIDAALHLGYEEKDIEDAFGEFFVSPLGVATVDKKADDLKYLKLQNLINDYKYNGSISDVSKMGGKLVLSGSPEVISDLEHKVKDIGYYCDTRSFGDTITTWSLRIFIEDKVSFLKDNLSLSKIALTLEDFDFTNEELLNMDFSEIKGHPKYRSINAVQAAIANEFGIAGGASSLTNIRKKLESAGKTKVKDLYEKVKNSKARNAPAKQVEEEDSYTSGKAEADNPDILYLSETESKKFFQNDELVKENIKNWGIDPKTAADFIVLRNDFNGGLPENEVNSLLIDTICSSSKEAQRALRLLFIGASANGNVSDDENIATKYKESLVQAATQGDPQNLPDFSEDFISKYLKDAPVVKTDELYDISGVLDIDTIKRSIKGRTPEYVAEYCRKNDVINKLKEEINKLKKEINSYPIEVRKNISAFNDMADEDTNSEDLSKASINSSLLKEADSSKEKPVEDGSNDELNEGFIEELEKNNQEFAGNTREKSITEHEVVNEAEKSSTFDSDDIASDEDMLNIVYTAYIECKELLEKLEGIISKVNKEETK